MKNTYISCYGSETSQQKGLIVVLPECIKSIINSKILKCPIAPHIYKHVLQHTQIHSCLLEISVIADKYRKNDLVAVLYWLFHQHALRNCCIDKYSQEYKVINPVKSKQQYFGEQ